MIMKTRIDCNALEAISLFAASREETRYAIHHICLELTPVETRLVATNGNHLGVYREKEAHSELSSVIQVLIPVDTVKQLKTIVTKSNNKQFDLIIDDKDLVFEFFGRSVSTSRAEGRYPDYMPLFPREVSEDPGQYAPEHLLLFNKAAKILVKNNKNLKFWQTCRLYQNGSGLGIVEMVGDSRFSGLVMSVRINNDQPVSMWWN